MSLKQAFERFTTGCARFTGRPSMLLICVVIGLIGVAAELSGNAAFVNGAGTAISIVTLLLLPILQASQNRDGAALHAKLDELIKTNKEARDELIGLEMRGEAEIEQAREEHQPANPV